MITMFGPVLAAEVLKSKHTFGYLITLLLPVVTMAIFTFVFCRVGFYYASQGVDTWTLFGTMVFAAYAFIFPLYTFLIAFLLNQIEYRSQGLKFIFTLPIPRGYFYLSKMMLTVYWLTISFLLAYSLFTLTGKTLRFMYPEMRLQEYDITENSVVFFCQLYIGCLSLLAIQTFFSTCFENFIKSIGIGVVLLIIGIFAFRLDYAYLFPYSFPIVSYQGFRMNQTHWNLVGIVSQLCYASLFFLAGYLITTKRQFKKSA